MDEIERRLRAAMIAAAEQPPSGLMEGIRRRHRRHVRRVAVGCAAVIVAIAFAIPVAHALRFGRAPTSRASTGTAATPYASWTKQLRGEVAYGCGDYICLMRPDGTGKRTLTAAPPEWDPAWSPDGRRLAFRGYYGSAKGDYDLYVVDANGCHVDRLTHRVGGISPSWSPTGRQIAYAVGGIDVINADGRGIRRLTRDTSTYWDDAPAWSAGNRLAFVRTRMGRSSGEIYTMNADGSGVAPLTRGAPGFGQPSWSPDGKSIAFVAYPSSSARLYSAGAIEVANADGTGVHQLSPPSWWSYSPTWTPGGKIVFLRQKGAPTQFAAAPTSAYIVNRDGTGLRLLYPNLDATQIAWGPTTLPAATC